MDKKQMDDWIAGNCKFAQTGDDQIIRQFKLAYKETEDLFHLLNDAAKQSPDLQGLAGKVANAAAAMAHIYLDFKERPRTKPQPGTMPL